MPANKNALIRYKTIDNCLRNRYRRWTLLDLVNACSDALYEFEGIRRGVSVRTVQNDLLTMRSERLGYNAPIEVYDRKYYRYADPDYSITKQPLSANELDTLTAAADLLRQLEGFEHFDEMTDIVSRLQDKISTMGNGRFPIIHFERNENLKGLEYLNPLYKYIKNKVAVEVVYQSFNSRQPSTFVAFPYLLKEHRNRWFLFCSRADRVNSRRPIFNIALDRILSISPRYDTPYRETDNAELASYFDDMIGVTKQGKPRVITFKATAHRAKYIATKPLHHSQQRVKRLDNGEVIFSLNVIINNELLNDLLSFGEDITVLAPQSLVKKMRDHLTRAAANYK